jgi:uncharacterized protein
MAMRWHDLLFMHWPVSVEALRPRVPPGLEIETFDGAAWLGVVPFTMSGVRHRLLPPLPGLSAFPELNVRTYVRAGADGRPGVWFFSLDAASGAAVWVARASFGLAYMNAVMESRREGEWIGYRSRRTRPYNTLAFGPTASHEAEFVARYTPGGAPAAPSRGTLEAFLTNRFCLYAWKRGVLVRGEIHHPPWPLQRALADVERNSMAAPLAIDLDALERTSGSPLLHFAAFMPVVAWLPERV